MRSLKFIVLQFFLLISPFLLKAQSAPQIPGNLELRTDQDFEAAEPLVIESSNWLNTTNLDQYIQERKKVNEFIWKWVSGTPAFTIDISDELTRLYENNIQLLSIFLANYARYYIQNKSTFTNVAASREGIYAIIAVYNKGIGIKKTKAMEKIVHYTPTELEKYIEAKFP
ncbi:MAG: hypothetical protein JSS67_00315 [Bacteroidetes bacterium]|nr:hypothetical protein [Bacteroidota bacterium]